MLDPKTKIKGNFHAFRSSVSLLSSKFVALFLPQSLLVRRIIRRVLHLRREKNESNKPGNSAGDLFGMVKT